MSGGRADDDGCGCGRGVGDRGGTRAGPDDDGCGRGRVGDRGGTRAGPDDDGCGCGEESTTSAAEPTAAPTTTSVPVPIPETGASGLPGQLLVALLAVSSGLALIMVGRRRQGVG